MATAHLLRDGILPEENIAKAREMLDDFAAKVAEYQDDGNSQVDGPVKNYVEAVRRGSSDATRRGQRHRVLLDALAPLYRKRSQ